MKHETPKYKAPSYSPARPQQLPRLKIYDFLMSAFLVAALIAGLVFFASLQGCGPHKAETSSYTSQFELAFTYQPYKVYIHKTWTPQERNCLANAIYAHLDTFVIFRGFGIAKQGKVFIHGRDVKFLNSPIRTGVTSYWDGVDEIHVVATSHKLPGLIEHIEKHQNPDNLKETWIPNGNTYTPGPQNAIWANIQRQLEDYAVQFVDLYQTGVPCKYDGR